MTTRKPPTPAKPSTGNNSGYTETLQAPVSGGRVTSGFGKRSSPTRGASSNHKGVDIAVSQGTPVHSAASGTVVFSGQASGYGNMIKVRHDDNTETVYGHLSERAVRTGDVVVGGEILGKSGGTPGTIGAGTSTGAHLHYEVIKNGVQVNPLAQTVGINANNRSKNTADQQIRQEAADRKVVLNYNQDEVIQKLISGEHFKDNPAEHYDNLTYHWRFFVAGDQEVINAETTKSSNLKDFYARLNTYEQVTIAESGVTTYSVDEVNMEAIVGTDFQAESTQFTSIEMKITEANGVNFLDTLRNAAIKLGVRNYQKCFYYLELTFKGYNEDGTINLKPFDHDIPNGGHWLWTVNITDIQVALSAGGGSYTLSMIPLADSLLTGTYNLIPTAVHPSGDTVGAFMDNLCNQLNNVWENIKGGRGIVVYKTKFHPVKDLLTAEEVRAMAVVPNEEDLNPIQGFDFDTKTRTAYISPNFTISRVLDSLMSSCEQAQNLAKDSVQEVDGVNDSPDRINPKGYRQSVLWRVEPEVNTPDYDPVFNEYYQHITLHVYGFRNHAAVLSPQDTTSEKATQIAILADMAKRNFLPKKYEYLFTGTNSEVLDIDLNFNLKWQALLPSISSSTQEQIAPQARVDPNVVSRNAGNQALAREQQAISAQQAGSDQTSAAIEQSRANDALQEARRALDTGDPNDPVLKQNLEKAKAAYQIAFQKTVARTRVTLETRAQLKAERPATIPQTNFGRSFGEDLTNQKTDFTAQERSEAFPITIQTYNPADTSGMSGQYHSGKSIYGAILNQVYGPLATQFFKISITIKGDPFWIGAGSFEQSVLRNTDEFDPAYPNFSEGANCFLFKMKYPLGQDANDNIILNTNESVTGIYQVNKISHRFSDGKFTQVLQALRVPIVDLYTSLYNSLYENKDQAIQNNQGDK